MWAPPALAAAVLLIAGPTLAQPPERPPPPPRNEPALPPEAEEQPPEEGQPPPEGAPPGAGEQPTEEGQPPPEGAPPGGEEGGDPEAGEGADPEGGAEEEEDADEGRAPLPDLATAPLGILPGEEVARPLPTPGSPVADILFGDGMVFFRTKGGDLFGHFGDARRSRWGIRGAGAVFLARRDARLVAANRDGRIALLRPDDGIEEAVLDTGLALEPGGVALVGDVLLLASEERMLGIRLPGGEEEFTVTLPAPARALKSREAWSGLAIASLGEQGVAAVQAETGRIRWHAPDAGPVSGPALPIPDEALVVVADDAGVLTALRREGGARRWQWRLHERVHAPPLLSRGRVYAATWGNTLYCYDLPGGDEMWRTALPGRPAATPLRIAGVILVATQDGLLVEFNPETGMPVGAARDVGSEIAGVVRFRGDAPAEDGWRDRRLFVGLRDGHLLVLGPRVTPRRTEEPGP